MVKPMISVIVPFYSNYSLLEYCCRSLIKNFNKHTYELIVVNDNPRTKPNLDFAPKATLIQCEKNGGYAAACNIGSKQAIGDFLLFVDSDIVIENDVMDVLLKEYSSNKNIAAVGSKIVKLATEEIEYYGLAFNEVDVIKPWQGNSAEFPLTMMNREFQTVPSGLFLIEKAVYDAVGGFDEKMLNCYCDLDLCLKVRKAGRTVSLAHESIGYHRGSSSGHVRHEWHADGKALFFKKWGNLIKNDAGYFYKVAADFYKENMELPSKCLAINLSRSIFGNDCLYTFAENLGIDLIAVENYRDRNHASQYIQLEDILTWSTMNYGVSILYFVDKFKSLEKNRYWFSKRSLSGDIIVDIHGNVFNPTQ
ncbi:glycosyltransferase [Maridesulfovibrio sp.]|uniref:glycosyltransferase n=1 Tax=Maridesulfovibrio sp. TaxID=2795000 RepID=UPI0029CA4F5D|nr:glycosyltransferase [Maridesulfovibrio sp.]